MIEQINRKDRFFSWRVQCWLAAIDCAAHDRRAQRPRWFRRVAISIMSRENWWQLRSAYIMRSHAGMHQCVRPVELAIALDWVYGHWYPASTVSAQLVQRSCS